MVSGRILRRRGRARQFLGAMRSGRCVSLENHAAGVPIRGGAVSTMALALAGSANDSHQAYEKPEPTRPSSGMRRRRGFPPVDRGAGELACATPAAPPTCKTHVFKPST